MTCPGDANDLGTLTAMFMRDFMLGGLVHLEQCCGKDESVRRALDLFQEKRHNQLASGAILLDYVANQPDITIGELKDALAFQKSCENPYALNIQFEDRTLRQHRYAPVEIVEFGETHGQKETDPCPYCSGTERAPRYDNPGYVQKLQKLALPDRTD